MNLQDVGQTGIEVAQHKCRATAVQVCGLNPAGWSILWTHVLKPYLWKFYASVFTQLAMFVNVTQPCQLIGWGSILPQQGVWSDKILFLWRLSKRNYCAEIHYCYSLIYWQQSWVISSPLRVKSEYRSMTAVTLWDEPWGKLHVFDITENRYFLFR